jgi:phosphocarrier protein NPr
MTAGKPTRIEELLPIANKYGLHARASTQLAQLAQSFRARITIARESRNGEGVPIRSEEVDAKSVLGILSLGAECGDSIFVRIEGDDSRAAIEALRKLVDQKFHEE